MVCFTFSHDSSPPASALSFWRQTTHSWRWLSSRALSAATTFPFSTASSSTAVRQAEGINNSSVFPNTVTAQATKTLHEKIRWDHALGVHTLDFFLEPRDDPALGHIHGPDTHAEGLGDFLPVALLDGRAPEGLPGGFLEFAPNASG